MCIRHCKKEQETIVLNAVAFPQPPLSTCDVSIWVLFEGFSVVDKWNLLRAAKIYGESTSNIEVFVCLIAIFMNKSDYFTLDLLWKLWLVESNSEWSWHDIPISVARIGLSCRGQILPSFQAPCPCSILKLLPTQREVSSFADCLKNA